MLEQSPPPPSPPVVPEERRRLIVAMLADHGSVTVTTVERAFGVSSMTARRDLAILANEGRLRRTHGGAVLPELAGHEDSFRSRLEQEADEKRRIGTAIAAGAEPNETIFIDSSTTSYFAVERLLELGVSATLLTNSLPVMTLVASAESTNLKLVGLGGSFRPLTQSFVGAETVRAIEGFYADRAVFSVKGISAEGFLNDPDALEAEVKRAMISHAARVVLVATHRKFEGRGLNVIVPAEQVQVAYLTDPPPSGARILADAGVEIVRV
ncbi:MAG TPA: DeoR/GlpR family DNA-binding transcription regulator [Gaiellales bacterium]|jgi:DeoR/GlpR family transcriptional regulator of sugar metabolism|nr:DeoR/GlpR family DNA-binding transcription regulator [Gaiellales bacterium]